MCFWRPLPPAGYLAMGCLASPTPPERRDCVVVARQAVVEALLSECMMLATNGNLWCIQNSFGSFEVAAPEEHHPRVRLRLGARTHVLGLPTRGARAHLA